MDTASDGTEALAKALDIEPDLVILDVMMPGIAGTEVYISYSRSKLEAG